MAEAEVVQSENEEEPTQDPLDPACFLTQPTSLLKSGTVKWYPEIDTQGGVDFVRLSKFDRHFVRFCVQRPMDLSRGVGRSANSTLFEDLLALRKAASVASVSAQMEMPEADQPMSQRRKKRVRDEDVCLVDPVVKILLPEGFGPKGRGAGAYEEEACVAQEETETHDHLGRYSITKNQRRAAGETLGNETEFPNTQIDSSVHHFDVRE